MIVRRRHKSVPGMVSAMTGESSHRYPGWYGRQQPHDQPGGCEVPS